MAREIYRNGGQFQTVLDLRENIFTIWNGVPASILQTHISAIRMQIFEDIQNDGRAVHY